MSFRRIDRYPIHGPYHLYRDTVKGNKRIPDRPVICRCTAMALRTNFKPGAQQSLEASRYFMELAADLLSGFLPTVEPRRMLLLEDGHDPLPLRIWDAMPSMRNQLAAMIPWLRDTAEQTRMLGQHGKKDVKYALELARTWMGLRHAEGAAFLEMLNPAHPFTDDECNELSVGILQGETVMLSARNVLFVKVSTGLYGLTVAGWGSFLFERIEGTGNLRKRTHHG